MNILKSLAVAAALSLTAGAALAAEAMDCCAKCDCCKDMKKPDGQAPAAPQPGHQHQH